MWNKWQLFHATDFQSLMLPCFTFFRILGIFPYKINVSIFEPSRPRYVLLTVVMCCNIIYQIIRIYYVLSRNSYNSKICQKIRDSCYFLSETFILIVWIVMTKPYMRLLQTISEVSSKLSRKSYKKLSKLIHFKDIFGFYLMIGHGFLTLSRYCFPSENSTSCVLIFVIEYYTRFQTFQISMLYIDCVCILKACFERIDDKLTSLRELIINDDSHPLGMIYRQQRNLLVLNEIKVLQKEYTTVSDVVQMLNMIFSPQILAIFTEVFTEVTFNLYASIVRWNNGIYINLTEQIHNFVLTSYLLYHITRVMFIVWACETSKNQAIKISTTIYDVSNSTNNDQIRNELRLFSLQVLHRDNTFSAKGFTIDATFLRKVQ
ncbi:hypothetical protein PUN28_007180 [Cardiocondyla obscurior]|uniref:Gustatory receptor n=4 Tax=Cardiocondyla obscurior TaxID=286306 RepID=A0AAW2G4Z9_9HYME